jgi:hypothetical protein
VQAGVPIDVASECDAQTSQNFSDVMVYFNFCNQVINKRNTSSGNHDNLLPSTGNVNIDGILVEIGNGKCENGSAWFFYLNKDPDALVSQSREPIQCVEMDESLDVDKSAIYYFCPGYHNVAVHGYSQDAV